MQMTGQESAFAFAALPQATSLPTWNVGSYSIPTPSTEMALLATGDGGAHWTDLTPPDPYSTAQMSAGSALFFVTAQTGWFAFDISPRHGPGSKIVIERTTDAGLKWQAATVASPNEGSIYLDFTSPLDGWILSLSWPGAGQMAKAVFRTEDGGRTWQQVNCSCNLSSTSLPGDSYPDGIAFDGMRGVVTALYHGDPFVWLYGTSDGGQTFQRVQLAVPKPYKNTYANPYPPVFSGHSGSMFVQFVGLSQPGAVLVFRTTDAGATWRPSGGPGVPSSTNPLTSGWTSPEDGYLLSSDGDDIFVTQDAGVTWSMHRLPKGAVSQSGSQPTVTFFDAKHGLLYAAKAFGTGTLYATSDAGRTWTKLSPQVAVP